MTDETIELATLGVLFGVVAFGAIVPVLPTGAAVSAAAVLAVSGPGWAIPVVIVVGAAGAYVGDLVTYRVLSATGEPLAERLGWLQPGETGRLDRLRDSVEQHELRTLLLSRLTPGGRIPVLVVAAFAGYPWRRFAIAAIGAVSLWSLTYAAIGVLGTTIFPDTRTALVVAVLAALVFAGALQLAQRLSGARAA